MHFQGPILSQKFKKTFNSSDQAFIFEVLTIWLSFFSCFWPFLMIFDDFLSFFDDFCKICQDKALITQKWRPGRWNWKVFLILEIKLVLGSAIFIQIGVVTIEILLIKKWCFFDFSINYCTLCGNLFKKIFSLNYPYMYIY